MRTVAYALAGVILTIGPGVAWLFHMAGRY